MTTDSKRFTLASLPEDERREASQLATDVKAALVKGLLHRADPDFMISGDSRGIETQAAVAAQLIDEATFDRIRPKLMKLKSDAGAMKKITGRSIEALSKPEAVAVKVPVKRVVRPKVVVKPKGEAPEPAPMKYSRLDLNIRAIQAMDETNPEGGTDDMVLGAMRIGASGKVGYTEAFFAGEFDDGTRREYGELAFGSVSLKSTPGFPKTFYWIFQLVESDSDDAEVAEALTSALSVVAQTVLTAAGQAAVGVVAAAIIDAIGDLIDFWIDDDYFPPYGVAIRLDSEDSLGADGVKDDRTGGISGHGGAYRIGYRLRLA